MVSTTATTLASNRRKYRLAQQNSRSSSTSSEAAAAQGQGHVEGSGPTAATTTKAAAAAVVVGQSSSATTHAHTASASGSMAMSLAANSARSTSSIPSPSATMLTRGRGSPHSATATRPQHLNFQQQPSYEYSQAPAPSSTSKEGAPTTETSGGISINNSTATATATTRGRSRRSRAATRRGVGGTGMGRVGRDHGAGSSVGSNSNIGHSHADDADQVPVEEQDDIFSSLSSVDNASSNAGGAGVHPYRQRIHRNSQQQQRHVEEDDHNGTPLNLQVVESVDSDDSGTCFNSVGTTTPRQPSPRHHVGGAHHGNNNNHLLDNLHAEFGQEQRQPDDPDQPDFNSTNSRQQRLLPSSKTKNRWRNNRGISNADNNMHLNSSDTLSPLHEHVSAAADSSTSPSTPSSFRKHGGNTIHEQQDEFGSKQSLPRDRNRSIWDRPEEMVANNHTSKNTRSVGPSDNGSAAYSEFDWDGSSSHQLVGTGGGGGGWDNYHAQHATSNTRQGPPSAQGSSAVEYSRYDADHDAQTYTNSSVGARGVEPFQRDATLYKRLGRQNGGGTLSNNGDGGGGNGGDDSNDDSNTDAAIFNQTNIKATFGVCAAATLGGAILGPIGILVGAASVGIGMGVMQIPEEQRNNVRNHAATSLEKMRNLAFDVSDTMSNNCAKYSGAEPSEVVGMVVPNDILDRCGCLPTNSGDGDDRGEKVRARGVAGSVVEDGHSLTGTDMNFEVRSEGSSPIGMNRLVGEVFGDEQNHVSPISQQINLVGGVGGMGSAGDIKGRSSVSAGGDVHGGVGSSGDEDAGQRVACGRKGRVVPLSQIHSLRPSLQPRAWLDVMASAHTTRDDKNEAMQEILILAKDKEISRWFLEEGILDSLMFILSSYFRNYSSFLRHETTVKMSDTDKEEPFSSYKQGGNAFYHAKLAANCCVALGKAHCAAVHTEGDLLLMSAYSRGSVPVERQLAQMLFEVPHHMKVMNPSAGSDTGESQQKFDAEFTLTELSMQQAEDLASSIKALDDGKIDV